MSEFYAKKDWTAVRIGSNVVGAVGPALANSWLSSQQQSSITIAMNDREYRLDTHDFQRKFLAEMNEADRRTGNVPDEFDFVTNMFNYRKRCVIPVPARSLDIASLGEIDYTAHSVITLLSALANFFTALTAQVQAEVHKCETPVEVVRNYAELVSCKYPTSLRNSLTWRGMPLNDIPQQSVTTKVKVIRKPFLNAAYDGYFEVKHLPASRAYGSLGSSGFESFVDWQVRSGIAHRRVLPANVIHVRASSLEEYALAEGLFKEGNFLEQYFTKTSVDPMDAAFFLSMAGDPLEEWLDGKTISMEEFRETVLGRSKADNFQGVSL